MDNDLHLYNNRIKRLFSLLNEYVQLLDKWDGFTLIIKDRIDPENQHKLIPYVEIEYYGYFMRPRRNGEPMAYKTYTKREFPFSLKEMDKSIDRTRQKINHEKNKQED